METADRKLIDRICRKNDRAATDELVRKYYWDVYAYLYAKCQEKQDAMDLTQDVFVSALKALHTYRAELSGFRTWLHHIAFSRFIDHTRRVQYQPLEEGEPYASEENDLIARIANQELLEKIESYVSQFEPSVQEIYMLHLHEDLSFRQIAGLLHLKEENVKAKYYRLLQKIRKEFADEYRQTD